MHDFISGIQQVGIGVRDAATCLHRYARLFGMDTLVFNDVSEAALMARYTGGTVFKRQALLSLNLEGGGGFEIWQFINRVPVVAGKLPCYGDLGIYAPKIKCRDNAHAHAFFSGQPGLEVSGLQTDPKGDPHFWVRDEYGNTFQIVAGNHWFQNNNKPVGGVTGAVIGVSDMDRSIAFYQSLLNIGEVVYDHTETIAANTGETLLPYRKVLLQKHAGGKGAFSKLLGSIEIELVQSLERIPQKIYQDRYWGDCGFIHLCFDVFDMSGLKQYAEAKGYRFTIDSIDSFGMEHAAGRFCYLEDPDGTLIELVETHKVPIYKKMGIYLNLKKRNLEKPLPDWMIRLLALSKVK